MDCCKDQTRVVDDNGKVLVCVIYNQNAVEIEPALKNVSM